MSGTRAGRSSRIARVAPTAVLVALALGLVTWRVRDYVANPWTRDGRVRAYVVQITTRVSGPIIELPIEDNQRVEKGDLLFAIDPSTFEAAVRQARGNLDQVRDELDALDKEVEAARASVREARAVIAKEQSSLKGLRAQLTDRTADYRRAEELIKTGTITWQEFDAQTASYQVAQSNVDEAIAAVLQAETALVQAEANLAQAIAQRGDRGENNPQLRAAQAALRSAELNLSFTRVRAPVAGYVTNLNLRQGSQTVANQAALALVDQGSFWVDAYFRETWVGRILPGDEALVTLLTYPDHPLRGRVASIGWGVASDNVSQGEDLLPMVNPTFEWIRLAQRIPVRIRLEDVPKPVVLRLGSTASVLVRTGSASTAPTPSTGTPARGTGSTP